MSSASSSLPSGRDYAATFESGAAANGLRRGGASDRLRDRLVAEEKQRLARIPIEPATIVNLHPFPLALNLGELGLIEVPACPSGQPFASLVLDRFRLAMRDLGDGNFAPLAVLPLELAREFEREYASTGGVFILAGNAAPSKKRLAEARHLLLLWHRREYQSAVDAWTRYRQHKFITERQRDAARELHRLGEIAALPEWVAITQPGAQRRACPACGEEIKPAARICRHCRFRLDPDWLDRQPPFDPPADVAAPLPSSPPSPADGSSLPSPLPVSTPVSPAPAPRYPAALAAVNKSSARRRS